MRKEGLCSKCQTNPRTSNGYCKPCNSARMVIHHRTPEGKETRWRNRLINKPDTRKMSRKNAKLRARGIEGRVYVADWRRIQAEQENLCAHCQTELTLQVDHIIPLAKGGPHWPFNIQGLCKYCNEQKNDTISDKDIATFLSRSEAVVWLNTPAGAQVKDLIVVPIAA